LARHVCHKVSGIRQKNESKIGLGKALRHFGLYGRLDVHMNIERAFDFER